MSTPLLLQNRDLVHPLAADKTRRIGLVIAATLVVALAAHVAFPLPFTPVPFTLQPLAVLGVGLLLGPVEGSLAMFAYLAEGAAGLPVFSPIGPGGVLQIVGATGGFLMAYPLVAFLCGLLSRGLSTKAGPFLAALLACSAATLVLFFCGAGWLAHLAHLSPATAWKVAVFPFLPGEAVKVLVAAGVYRALTPARNV